MKRGNWGNKLVEGARWVHKGKLAAWGPERDDWEVEERARKRIKRMLPAEARSPSPPRFPHLRSPSPPLVAPYLPPTTQHMSFTSFVLDPAAQHTFRSRMLNDLERATCGLIEGESALRRAMGRLWEVLGSEGVTRAKSVSEAPRSPTIPKKEDVEGDEDFSEREGSSASDRPSATPEIISNIHSIFIEPAQDVAESHSEAVLPTNYEASTSSIDTPQEEILDKGLATLRELQEDGREYVERLEEIREGLGLVRNQRQGLWTVIRERALKEMEEGELL